MEKFGLSELSYIQDDYIYELIIFLRYKDTLQVNTEITLLAFTIYTYYAWYAYVDLKTGEIKFQNQGCSIFYLIKAKLSDFL